MRLLLLALALLVVPARAQDVPVAFVDVTVLPMRDDGQRAVPNQTVLVRGDRIVAVGPVADVAVPADARRIDGAGRYLLPGLAEMHGHVPPPSADPQHVEDVLALYLAGGITTVRGMLGHEGQLDLKRRANGGDLLAPTLYLAGPSFNGNSVESPEAAVAMVRRQVAEGWDLLKIHPGLSRAEYDAMAREAHASGIRFGGHVPADVGLRRALAAGQETFDHVDGYLEALDGFSGPVDEAELAELVRLSREAGAWIVPTMALWEVLLGAADPDALAAQDELRYWPAAQVQSWERAHAQRRSAADFDPAAAARTVENRQRVLRALHEGGVRILMGTDAPQQYSVPGLSLGRELERMTAAGMTPYDVLVSGTRAVGEYFANEDRFGLVAPGHRADLLLLEANPLDDLDALQQRAGLMVRGRWVPEAEIEARLAEIEARSRE